MVLLDIADFHISLTQAQEMKCNKLEYDIIATEILSSPYLKPQQTQIDSIAWLNAEIAALE